MGNAQSVPDGRKISKPQTNGNHARLSKSLSPANASEELKVASNGSEHSSRESPSTVTSPTSDGTVDAESRHQSLSHTITPQDSISPLHKQGTMDSLAASVARSLSRRGSKATYTVSNRSSVAQLQNGSQLSVGTEKAVDIQSAIAILQELRKTASPEDMAALHKALMPAASVDSLAPTVTSEPPEDLDPATAAMIRRKSFAQPGVATRYAKALLRKSVPAPSSQPTQPWTKDMMGASPLARLSSLDMMEPPTQHLEQRAQTPSEEDYTQLGNLKHGSLQVVNGCPSPVPSMASPGRTGRKVSDERDENYFTASERGDDSRPSSKQTPTMPQSAWQAPNTTEVQPRGRGVALDYSTQKRETSPLKHELRIASLDAAQDADAESVYSKHMRHERSTASLHSQSGRRFSFEEEEVSPVEPPAANAVKRLPQASQSAISLADDYAAEMPDSPYKATHHEAPTQPPHLPQLQDVVRPPMSPVSGIREQIVVMPTTSAHDFAPISPRKPLSSHPTPEKKNAPTSLPTLPQQKPRRPAGVKVDSGYSSNASARNSLQENVSPIVGYGYLEASHTKQQPSRSYAVQNPVDLSIRIGHIAGKTSPPADLEASHTKQQQSRSYAVQNPVDLSIRIGHIAGKTSPPAEGSTPVETVSAVPVSSGIVPAAEAVAEDDIVESIERDPTPQEKMNRKKSWRKSVRRSLPRLMSADSAPSVFSKSTSAVSDGTANSESKPIKKLQKRRPLSQPPINMSDRHLLESGIPRVPSSVFSRYSTRLSASPGMQHLDETLDNSVNERESSFDPAQTASKSNLPSCFFPDAEEAPAPPAHRRMSWGRKSFRRSRSKSQVDEQEILSNGIADFGTVGQSLGTSPYDAAMPPMPRHVSGGVPTQPHHLSTMSPRPGPREGWDDQTAAQIAQTRSRERASQLYALEQQRTTERSAERSRSRPARPISYHEDMKLHIYTPAPPERSPPRPKSVHAETIPTLPNVPLLNQDPRPARDTERAQSRPRTPYSQGRDPSPVKSLVSAFEQRATEGGSAPPLPSASIVQQPDWTDSSRVWRERRLYAAQTASPPPKQKQAPTRTQTTTTYSQPLSVTTTTTTALGTRVTTTRPEPRPTISQMQNRKSMPQMRQVPGAMTSHTTTTTMSTMYGGGGGARQSYVHTTGGANRNSVMSTTTSTRSGFHGMDFGDVPVRVI